MGGVAVVTGSASGIGAAVRERLETEGDRVVGVDIRDAEVIADLSTPEGRNAAITAAVEAAAGPIDRVVVCAGLGPEMKPASRTASVNYFGAVDVLDGLLPSMRGASRPAAVAICSNSAQIAPLEEHPFVLALLDHDEKLAGQIVDEKQDGFTAYGGSKHALGRAVRRRALEWGKSGVRLNAVAPGPVNTPLLESGLTHPVYGKAIANLELPVGRRGEPAEIANLVAFLLGPDAGFIHGSIYYIDGGMDAQIRPDKY